MWFIYTMEYYAAEKNNDIMKFAGKWMELENVILSEALLGAGTQDPATEISALSFRDFPRVSVCLAAGLTHPTPAASIEKSLFIFSDTDRALLTQAPEDTRTHRLIISSRKVRISSLTNSSIDLVPQTAGF
ncbi:hypothetical protein STEG23_012579 [Scotinomys teguina]